MQLKLLQRRNSVALSIIKSSEGHHSCSKCCDFLAAQMLRVRKEQSPDFSAWINGHALPVLFMDQLQGPSQKLPLHFCLSTYVFVAHNYNTASAEPARISSFSLALCYLSPHSTCFLFPFFMLNHTIPFAQTEKGNRAFFQGSKRPINKAIKKIN